MMKGDSVSCGRHVKRKKAILFVLFGSDLGCVCVCVCVCVCGRSPPLGCELHEDRGLGFHSVQHTVGA